MPDLLNLLKEKNRRLKSVPDTFLTSVEKAEKNLIGKILDVINKLDVEGGVIVKSKHNLTLINSISDEIKTLLLKSDYVSAVRTFAKEFDTQAEITDDYFKGVFNASPVVFADAVLEKSKKQAVKYLLEAPLDAEFILPIEDILINSVSSGASFTETIQAIRTFAEADGNGKLAQYSKQIAYDSFAISDRSYTSARAEELDLQWYIYSGGELPTTREFCEARREKYYHKKEIELWVTDSGSEESNPNPRGDWAGKIPETNSATIFDLAGGFNCRHSINPVSIASVPSDVIQRNIENGNYEPTKEEIDILQL